MMVRSNLPAAMQGMVVVPIFAGYDLRREYGPAVPATTSPAAATRRATTSPPARAACTPARSSRSASATASAGTRPSTWPAARCGRPPTPIRPPAAPTCVRGHLPGRGHHHRDGFERVADAEWPSDSARCCRPAASRRPQPHRGDACHGGPAMSMPFYVAPEQVMKDRADYARKGIARGRALAAAVYDDGIVIVRREPVEHAAQDQRDLRPHRLRRRRQVQRVRPAARRRRARRRPQGLPVQPRRRRRPQPGQPVRADPRPDLHPRDEADGGRDPRGRGRRRAATTTSCSTSSTTAP